MPRETRRRDRNVGDHLPTLWTTGTVAFYGPCEECCGELRATYAGVARVVEVARFEPKMHVVPNQVATKD
jgi:hypothetical protein